MVLNVLNGWIVAFGKSMTDGLEVKIDLALKLRDAPAMPYLATIFDQPFAVGSSHVRRAISLPRRGHGRWNT